MSRDIATFNFSGNFDVQKAAPLDNRCIVNSKDDLTKQTTWQTYDGNSYTYVGMLVVCKENTGKVYQLTQADYTKAENWVLVGDTETIADLYNKVAINKSSIDVLNGDDTIEGSVAKSIKDVIEGLDVAEVGGDTKYISSIKEENGKIVANAKDLTSSQVNRTATEASSTQIALSGTTVESSLVELAKNAKTLQNTIDALDLEEVGTTGQVITRVSQTDGQVSATATDLISSIVARQETSSSNTKVEVKGTTVEGAIESLATSIKTVKDNAAKYSITKITDNLATNVREAYQLVETVEGVSTNVGSQIPIYKDSSLKSVTLSDSQPVENGDPLKGQFLVLTYILDTGQESVQYLDVSKFLIESEFKDGLQVNASGEVSIKIDDDSQFLSVSEKGLKVSGIENTTDKVTVAKEITVEGGPLSDLYKNSLGKNTISADITMQELLELLFTQELWPTNISFTEGSISASIAAPSFSVNSTLVEVGSTITVSACTPTATSYSTSARKLYNMTYGYSTDKSTKNSSTSISVSATNATLTGNYTVTRTGVSGTETKTGAISDVALASGTLTAVEGSNTIKVAITGASASCTFNALDSVWYYSNLNNLNDSHKTSSYSAVTKSTSTPTNSKSITVTGVYPIYATKSSITSLDKLSLQTSTTYEINMPAETSTDKQGFAIPASKSVKSIQLFDTVANVYKDYTMNDFTMAETSKTSGNSTIKYNQYTRNAGTNGACKFKIIIS